MLFDILAVFVVTLISSLFLCTTSVHGLPTSSSIHQYIHKHPRTSLRHLHHHPLSSVNYDLGGDTSQMSIDESNEYSTIENRDDDDDDDDDILTSPSSSSSSFFASSLDTPNESLNYYAHALPSKPLFRKLLLSLQKSNYNNQQQQKRSDSSPISASSLPTQFNFNPAVAAAAFADPSNADNVVNLSNLSESTRLSPSLKALVETNPFARAWLTMLLQKVMEEQPVPYIFKYGRRRKK